MTVQPVPQGCCTVTPWIIGPATDQLIDYLKAASGAEELGRLVGASGSVEHAEVRIGDSVVMMFDARPDAPPTPAFLRLFVEDADAVHRAAVAAGGTSVTEVTHLSFGDRVGRVRDPQGNLWWIQTHVEDVSPGELQRRLADPEFARAMDYVRSAELLPGRAAGPPAALP